MFSTETWLWVIGGFVVIATGFSLFARWTAFAPAVAQSKLNQLRVGMTEEQVRELLGTPLERREDEKGFQFWLFGSRLKRHVLVVEFDASRKVIQFVHGVPDVHKPGKLLED